MGRISEKERNKLSKKIRTLLGMSARSVELDDETIETLVEMAIDDYSEQVNDWLIDTQWTSLYGLNIDEQSLTKAFMTRSLDWETQYTYAYSKIVGLQTKGDYVLKKDKIDLVSGQQTYEIPAGREINELLWLDRSELDAAFFDPFMGGFGGFGGIGLGGGAGFSQMGTQGNYFVTPANDLLMRMQDINLKRRIIGSELTYRITGLPDGKKLVHLMNVPGGKFDFGNLRSRRNKVWYWYYDAKDREDCLEKNKDVIRLPSDVPIDEMKWDDLNEPAKNWVRRYAIAYSKETLGRIRGKFSGVIKTPTGDMTMDYSSLLTESSDEKSTLKEELKLKLDELRPDKMMERKANQAEQLNRALKQRAFRNQIYKI